MKVSVVKSEAVTRRNQFTLGGQGKLRMCLQIEVNVKISKHKTSWKRVLQAEGIACRKVLWHKRARRIRRPEERPVWLGCSEKGKKRYKMRLQRETRPKAFIMLQAIL